MSTEEQVGGEMPFLDHLEELRWRIVKSLVALIVAFMGSMALIYDPKRFDVVAWLIKPIEPYLHGQPLLQLSPLGNFSILLKIAAGLSIALASPVVIFQIWSFLAPALQPRERKTIIPVLIGAAGLFLAGVAVSVFVFVPVTMGLMENIKSAAVNNQFTIDYYFDFIFGISLAFGALFELPILILLLTALGLVTPKLLTRYRRHAFIGGLILCEIITPGDMIISTLVLFVPVYGLYELSIIVSWFVYRAKQRRAAAAELVGDAA